MIFYSASRWFPKMNAFFLLTIPVVTSGDIEDIFVEELGNNPIELVRWSITQDEPVDKEFLKMYCAEIHGSWSENQGYNIMVPADRVDVAVFESVLRFREEKYKPMRVMIMKYSLDGPSAELDCQRRYHYLTGGDEARCEFPVRPSSSEGEKSFYLDDSMDESRLRRTLGAENVSTEQSGSPSMTPQGAEDMFVQAFGNDSAKLVKWTTVQEDPVDMEFLKINCIKTQKTLFESYNLSFEARVDEVDVVVFESALRFHNEIYKPMKVTVVKYTLSSPMRPGGRQTYHHLTGGDESNCVFYITPSQADEGNGFYIDDLVCESKLFRRPDRKDAVHWVDP